MKKIKFIFLPFTVIIALMGFNAVDSLAFNKHARSEGVIEIFQACFYLTSGAVMLIIAYWNYRKEKNHFEIIFPICLAIALLFIGMEELSWGQKIFHFATPESVAVINEQQEFTLHNLKFLQKTFLLHTSFIVFSLFFIAIGEIDYKRIEKFKTPKYLYAFFAFPAFFYFYIQYLYLLIPIYFNGYLILGAGDQEVFELILSLGLLFYSWICLKRSQ